MNISTRLKKRQNFKPEVLSNNRLMNKREVNAMFKEMALSLNQMMSKYRNTEVN